MTGLLLRLAGPLQSWGDHSTFSTRDTRAYPTRSALIGLIASALGRRREEPISDLTALAFTIRVDRAGAVLRDFHTVGGGLARDQTVPTAEGSRRGPGQGTIVSHRYYLTDAAFTVAMTGPQPLVDAIANALDRPAWAPYLGRRSCPAEAPLLLQVTPGDPVHALYQSVPMARPPVTGDTVPVDFVLESPPPGREDASQLTANDVPLDFHPHRRRYLSRSLWITRQSLPADLCVGLGDRYLTALATYLKGAPA
ncbi:type I-E CRISPR-associated protein Cas5/CasD [Solwaraspora sp. WMMD1047]|uniref:type I-E CRISPR-associated protein Cas5/CasD n=1 Tax=Solwaraspora sp. WMMD1047 TaxID=3016102 RepID=UPI002417F374|nr:type I-E CRISPR-associated protein Cas5/CasD [Solwaraspora sp. WMMD1047]MDG4827690.1 type I-E CRISPR-associated protein Cas5/CasD [Solwaraspora sp. WMMD1047]MDG4834881.1 type I-E CRISPR-associated protein Cas5/CasD [Solwaraspora sp. WMMD1047]MDG4834888.1 type I-E CRISPR-associated protein Cas5/CasD [Solwaraspora sp. WMMD1047]